MLEDIDKNRIVHGGVNIYKANTIYHVSFTRNCRFVMDYLLSLHVKKSTNFQIA